MLKSTNESMLNSMIINKTKSLGLIDNQISIEKIIEDKK